MEIKNLAGLEKPLEKLIDSIAAATGVIYEPTRIVRKAKAVAEASLIIADAESQKNDLARRAIARIGFEEVRRQQNIESIVGEAAKALPQSVNSETVDQDWINYFFGECRDVSDEDMQKLWGKLLAGEVAEPGKFSRRTLSMLKIFTKIDSHLIAEVSPFIFRSDGGPLGFIPHDGALRKCFDTRGPSIGVMIYLESLGLAGTDLSLTFEFNPGKTETFVCGKKMFSGHRRKKEKLSVPIWTISPVVVELASVVESDGDEEFIETFKKIYGAEIDFLAEGGSK